MEKIPMGPTRIFVVGSFVVACSVVVPRLPGVGESLNAAAFVVEPGGKGFNLAVTAHRLGVSVDGVFAIGTDAFSELAVSAFRRSGLSVDMLARYETTTGAGVGFIDASGENCLAVHLGANGHLSAQDVQRAAGIVVDSRLVMATFEAPNEPILAAFQIAHDAGRLTLLNPSPYRSLDPKILERTSILVVNRIEAEQISADFKPILDDKPPVTAFAALAHSLMEHGPDIVVVTLGSAGAVAFRRHHAPYFQPAIPVATIDTIGAGDAFSAGLATGLATDLPFDVCMMRAAACGAIATRKLGAFESFPTAHELERFLEDHRVAGQRAAI